MRQPVLIGIDLGTSAVKAGVIDRDGRLLASAGQELALHSPHPGWAEQDPEAWARGAAACARKALEAAGVSAGQVAGVGLSGQMHTLVCVDAHGEALRPAITWADRRSQAQAEAIRHELGEAGLLRWAGNPPAAGLTAPTWRWLAEHEPEVTRRTAHLLLAKDFVRLRMTGEIGTDPSDASATLLFDPFRRAWSEPLLAWADVKFGQLPPVQASAHVGGGLQADFAAAAGLRVGTPVVVGAGDQAAQAVGQGVTQPGQISLTIGSGGQIFSPLAEPVPDPELRLHLFCHAVPDRWHLEAATLTAGLALRWLRDRIAPGTSYGELADAASTVEAGLEGLFFLPYLSGERTPHFDPAARASFVGLTLEHGRAHLARAVMEGVLFGLRQGLERVEALAGRSEPLLFSGGASRHPLWLRLAADILDRRIAISRQAEAAARGAALLAGIGVGMYTGLGGLPDSDPDGREMVEPEPRRAEAYARAYRTFCGLYPALAGRLG
jgi:xylulokinase